MGIADRRKPSSEGKLWRLCPFWQSGNGSPSSSSTQNFQQHKIRGPPPRGRHGYAVVSEQGLVRWRDHFFQLAGGSGLIRRTISTFLMNWKQVKSAVRMKNTSRSHVAFKFQTTAPKSCYMRPPGGILAPGESIIAYW
ncbi:Vesicle-associated protein 4-1 [Vitis vinifera]|uniref:Vesicle-associated protein 4-1 n=1 Tax=Vitis vinifera TaxID=29760 RepID=A0A438GD23_VITVI|nr:Vesicle-associated protein 4-1 [Vitis vinifera]